MNVILYTLIYPVRHNCLLKMDTKRHKVIRAMRHAGRKGGFAVPERLKSSRVRLTAHCLKHIVFPLLSALHCFMNDSFSPNKIICKFEPVHFHACAFCILV